MTQNHFGSKVIANIYLFFCFHWNIQHALKAASTHVSNTSLEFLKAVANKNLSIPVALKPNDDHIEETLSFMEGFNSYWKTFDRVSPMEVRY